MTETSPNIDFDNEVAKIEAPWVRTKGAVDLVKETNANFKKYSK